MLMPATQHKYNNIIIILIGMLLASCSALPGMGNIDTATTRFEKTGQTVAMDPVIFPITLTSIKQRTDKHDTYRVAPQDVLSITVWNYAEFNTPLPQSTNTSPSSAGYPGYLVDSSGNIYFPLIGSVHVEDKSIDEIRRLLNKKLSYYLRKPNVLIRVADFRSKKIYVMGEVMKPGILSINDQPISLIDALTMAGSLDPNASDPRHIYIMRGDISHPKIYWLNASTPAALLLGQNFMLKDHDIVIVSTAAVTRWNRFLNQLLPSLQTIWYTKAITGK